MIAWLRRRREDPPTEEEIRKNVELAMLKKERAKEIEIRDAPIRPKKEDKLSDKVNSKIAKTSLN